MNTKEYNGWTNYETWLVKLWMDNDQGSYEYWREQSRSVSPNLAGRVSNLANQLKAEHEDYAAEKIGDNGWLCDLVGAALGEVNWHEIAESLIDDTERETAEA